MYAKNLDVLNLEEYKKIGYCYKCMGSGFWALRQKDFRKALQALVMEVGKKQTTKEITTHFSPWFGAI